MMAFCLTFASTWANAAEQIPDSISINSKSYQLLAEPLEDYRKSTGAEKPYLSSSPAMVVNAERVRGYSGKWQIKNNKLFLVSLSGWMLNPKFKSGVGIPTPFGPTAVGNIAAKKDFLPLSLSSVFPANRIGPDGVLADWFSGQLRVGIGPVLIPGSGPRYACLHTKELLIRVNKGILAKSALTLEYSPFKTDLLDAP